MTVRTQAELETQFQENSIGSIGADDHKDLLDTLFQRKLFRVHGQSYARLRGAGKPSAIEVGVTNALSFAVGEDAAWHFTLHDEVDPDEDITVNIDLFPVGVEAAGRLVSFDVDYLVMGADGTLVNSVSGSESIVDLAVPTTQYEDFSTSFTIDSSLIDEGDHEVKMRVTRVASSNDPAAEVAIHHSYVDMYARWPGAT